MEMIDVINEHFPKILQTEDLIMKRTEYTMKAYIISMINNMDSITATRKLIHSIEKTDSNLDVFISNAVTPDTIDSNMRKLFDTYPFSQIGWTWPKTPSENQYSISSGLEHRCYDSPYGNYKPRFACTLSHYNLWKLCVDTNETIMILEHDALFKRKFDYSEIEDQFTGDILGLNDPSNATRKADVFNRIAMNAHIPGNKYTVSQVPTIDDDIIPQGLAGNSAYIIKPAGAAKLMSLCASYGFWPNDAIMCKQLMPGKLQVVVPYLSQVQGIKSTTST